MTSDECFCKTNRIRRWGKTGAGNPGERGRVGEERAAGGGSKRKGTREAGETEGIN